MARMGRRERWLARGLGLLLGACAAAQSRPDEAPVSLAQVQAQQVARILQARHPSHAPLDAELGARVLEQLRAVFDPERHCGSARLALDGAQVAAALARGD